MAKADLRVTIDAETAKFERALDRARRATMRMESQLRSADLAAAELDRMLEQQRTQAMERTGRAMLVMGAGIAAGLGLAVKAAMDWESAWTGVEKVIEGTPEQLARLEGELRQLATTLPFTHEEIAAVASAAGQLGIATEDITGFTRVMLDLGVATNMTAEEAAFALARMSNIMGTASDDVSRLGATIVDLGNNSATTERDIVEMALRIAGAGNTIGLTEADVLAFASALSSVGIEAQAGGTAISRVMIEIADAVAGGGDAVAEFADVAGMSAGEFARAFEEDPARAIAAFVAGLGRIDDAGGNVFAVLEDLGLSEIRVRDALLRISGAGDLLTDSLDRGATAWDENTALIEEAERRYDDAASKVEIAKNALVDLAIDVGSVLLPIFVELVEVGTDIVRFFSDLPGPVKAIATIFGSILGATMLVSGAFLMLAPRISAARAELLILARTAPVAYGALVTLGQAAGIVSGLLAVAGAVAAIHQATKTAPPEIGETTQALLDLADGIRGGLIDDLADAHRAMQEAEEGAGVVATGFSSSAQQMSNASAEFERIAGSIDTALAQLVAGGHADKAAEIVNELAAVLGISGSEMQALADEHLPEYGAALDEVDVQQRLTAESAEGMDSRLLELADRFGLTGEDAEEAAQKLLDSWAQAGAEFVDVLGAYETALSDKEEAERETAQATADATEDATDSWEDYVGDVELTVDEYLEQLERMVENQANWRDNLVRLAGRASDELLGHLISLGPEGADLVALFAEMTDEELARAEEAWSRSTEGSVQAGIIDPVIEAGPVLIEIAQHLGEDVADRIREYMIKHEVDVFTAARRLGIKIDKGVREGEDREIPVRLTGYDVLVNQIDTIGSKIRNLPDRKTVEMTFAAFGRGELRTFGRARGGEIRGPGGPTDDRAGLFALSDGEFVVNARDAQRNLALLQAINAGRRVDAMGGPVSRITVEADSRDLRAADFGLAADRLVGRAANAAFGTSGKVLPPGSYRIGRGPAAHGYNARDLPAPIGTPVYSAAAGIVTRAMRLATSYGIHAKIGHAGWSSLYAHLSQMYVRAGQEVARGQLIGRVGSTGNSTGPHLHLEPDNPRLYDRGGKLPHGGVALNTSGGTEYVLSPQQSRMFDRMISVMESAQNEAFELLMSTLLMGRSMPVAPAGPGTPTVGLHITGSGPLYEQIAQGVRTGQLHLSAGGARVTVG